jgi:predicted RNase H-like HicB family nuclease
MIFHVTLDRSDPEWVVVECPAPPGCVSQGHDEKEALENIKEAITAWMWAEDQKALPADSRRSHADAGRGLTWARSPTFLARMRSRHSCRRNKSAGRSAKILVKAPAPSLTP